METKNKPTLSDVLNAIISSVSKGRQVADFEAMRMAMSYQKIDLLRGLPVPRMRINNVKISIPMILSNVIQGQSAAHAPLATIVNKAEEATRNEVNEGINWINKGLVLANTDKNKAQHKALERYKEILDSIAVPESNFYTDFKADFEHRLNNDLAIYKYSTNGLLSGPGLQNVIGECVQHSLNLVITDATFKWISERIAKQDGETFDPERAKAGVSDALKDKIIVSLINKVRNAVENMCVSEHGISPEMEILVDTESIKNAGGGPDTITRLSFVLREEGLEWITEVGDDNIVSSKLSTE